MIVLPSIEMNERNEERWRRISPLSNVWSVQPLCLTMNRSNRKTNLIWESSNIKEEKISADDLLFHWLTKINTRTFLLSIIFTGITVFREKIDILIREINEHTFPLQTTIETIPRERERRCVAKKRRSRSLIRRWGDRNTHRLNNNEKMLEGWVHRSNQMINLRICLVQDALEQNLLNKSFRLEKKEEERNRSTGQDRRYQTIRSTNTFVGQRSNELVDEGEWCSSQSGQFL